MLKRSLLLRKLIPVVSGEALSPQFVKVEGKMIPYPSGLCRPIDPSKIGLYGEGTLSLTMEENNDADRDHNIAQAHYATRRSGLLAAGLNGWWLCTAADGSMGITATEMGAKQFGSQFVKNGAKDFFFQCLGREVSEYFVMDSLGTLSGNPVLPAGTSSCVHEDMFFISADHAFSKDDATYTTHVMKVDSGATATGIPEDVLSNPPAGVDMSLLRGADRVGRTGWGNSVTVRQYHGQCLRINDHVVELSGLQIPGKQWLLGYDVLKSFSTTLNPRASEPVTLTALPSEEK